MHYIVWLPESFLIINLHTDNMMCTNPDLSFDFAHEWQKNVHMRFYKWGCLGEVKEENGASKKKKLQQQLNFKSSTVKKHTKDVCTWCIIPAEAGVLEL